MPWTKPRTARRRAPQTSTAFPLDWGHTRADMLELTGNLIEAACYVVRHRWNELRADRPLSALTCLIPDLGTKPLGEMSASELSTLVDRLRTEAERLRENPKAA